ncbi:MAG: NAD(P)-dependent oxidoreductase [Pseudomonadota bacterium]
MTDDATDVAATSSRAQGGAATNTRKLLLSDSLAPAARRILDRRADIEQVYFPHLLPNADFLARVKQEAPVAGWTLGATRIDATVIEAAEALQVTARIGVGFDAIDVPAHTERGIPVMTAGTGNSPSVAEHALFMMLALARRSAELDHAVRNGRWLDRMQMVPLDLYGRTVLVIGFGRIGSRTAKRCAAMEMDVAIYDPLVDAATIEAAGYRAEADLDAAIAAADIVTIHCPKSPETLNMFDAARIARMKPTAYLINTARGGLIDEAALAEALDAGRLAGAGLDVFAEEPVAPDNPLLTRADVITSPHMAGVTREALERMGINAVNNILSVFDGAPIVENTINADVFDT